MTDAEIERMTLCIAQMAATLQAGALAGSREHVNYTAASTYVNRARELYETAAANVADQWPTDAETTQ